MFNDLDKFEKEVDQLVKLFEKKASLTPLQESHGQLKAALTTLKINALEDIHAVPV